MPGSPPKRMSDPGTIPPPKTLFNSSSVVFSLGVFVVSISAIFKGLETRSFAEELVVFQVPLSGFWTSSSTIVFHDLHEVHCPCHLAN